MHFLDVQKYSPLNVSHEHSWKIMYCFTFVRGLVELGEDIRELSDVDI